MQTSLLVHQSAASQVAVPCIGTNSHHPQAGYRRLQSRPCVRCVTLCALEPSDCSSVITAATPLPWDYKYSRTPCISPCRREDTRCHKLEALMQNVLSYPAMPLSVHRRLDRITASVEGITDLVERMADYWGKELALYFIRKCPLILQHEFRTVMNNCQHVQQLIGLQTSEMALLLRKNPALLILEPVLLHSRYEALPQLTEYNQQQVNNQSFDNSIQ